MSRRHHWLYTEEHAKGEIKCARQVGRTNAESMKSIGIKIKHNFGVEMNLTAGCREQKVGKKTARNQWP